MSAANHRSETFPKSARLRKRSEYLETYRAGRKTFGRYVIVFTRPNDGQEPRFGVTATRKVGKAHVRNQLKRWTREIFRRYRDKTGFSALGVDLVVNLKQLAADAEFAAFRDDVLTTLNKAARDARRAMETSA